MGLYHIGQYTPTVLSGRRVSSLSSDQGFHHRRPKSTTILVHRPLVLEIQSICCCLVHLIIDFRSSRSCKYWWIRSPLALFLLLAVTKLNGAHWGTVLLHVFVDCCCPSVLPLSIALNIEKKGGPCQLLLLLYTAVTTSSFILIYHSPLLELQRVGFLCWNYIERFWFLFSHDRQSTWA